MLPQNFYDDVEKPGALKHVLYGDSVSKDMKTLVKFKGSYIEYITFDELWNRLILTNPITALYRDKEYIFTKDEIETVSYDVKANSWCLSFPRYIMRHKINKEIIRLNFKNLFNLDVTDEHSMLDYNPVNQTLKIKKPNEIICAPYISISTEINYKLFRIEPAKVISRERIQYDDYVYDISVGKIENFIANGYLVHNTDSIFIVIPHKDSEKLTTKEKLVIVDKVSNDINSAVTKYLNEYFLPKSNISIDQNSTYFKSEMLMKSIAFLDVKKNYAYKLEAKKGKILDKPEVEYTGIQVVRSNAAKLTQNMLREIIEDIVLNDQLNSKEKLPKVSEIVNKFHTNFLNSIDNLDLAEISIPGKWSKADQFINGMTLYNFIMKKEIFSMGSAGNFIYCNFKNPKLFQSSNLDMTKVKGIVIPQVYNKSILNEKFNEYQIQIDKNTQWDTLYSTTVGRIVELVKTIKE